ATPEVQGDNQSPGVPAAEDSSSEADLEPIVAAEPPLDVPPESPQVADAVEPPPVVPAQPLPDRPLRIEPAPELVRQAGDLEQELARIAAEADSRRGPIAAAARTSRDSTQQLAAAETLLSAEAGELAAEQRRLSALQRQVEQTHDTLRRRQSVVAEAERQQPAVLQIRHRLTPVSRAVEGREMHFHLAGGRIAYVPVDELVEQLKVDVGRQKDWLARVPRHEGRVGPIGGFSMAYVVERQSLSVVEEMRVGGVVRISVAEWRIIPGPEFPSESAAEALSPGSAFIRRLQTTGLDTTLTFWVYPDSFEAFRQLQELARAEGFTVAARPLPEGTPIAASPQGTRSAGQ
ncbi:MAG TPA: hypothetical protein VML55_09140, partial [Planctomycetaceae bacterium]|nr:hypothetical protein [Planctomycetaceae bacterium]